jgi:hypothetical protein
MALLNHATERSVVEEAGVAIRRGPDRGTVASAEARA